MKRVFRFLAVLLIVLGLHAGTVVPSQAAQRLVDVKGFSASSVVFSKPGCKYITVKMRKYVHRSTWEWNVDADVTHKGRSVSTALFSDSGDSSRTRIYLCDFDGFGKYTIGPSNIFAHTYNYGSYQSNTDWTKGHFYVRAKVKAGLKAKRRGNKVALTASARRYSADRLGFVNYAPKKARVQVKSGKKWKTVKSVKLRHGKATVIVKSKRKKQYRFVIDKSSSRTSAKSKIVKA